MRQNRPIIGRNNFDYFRVKKGLSKFQRILFSTPCLSKILFPKKWQKCRELAVAVPVAELVGQFGAQVECHDVDQLGGVR